MKRIFVGLLIGLTFVLGSRAGIEGLPRRIFYLFSPQVPEHCQRARDLQRLIDAGGDRVQVVGVVRLAGEGTEGLESFRHRHGLSYLLLDSTAAPELPVFLQEHLGQEGDYVLLLDSDAQILFADTGEGLAQLLADLAPVPLATEVDESTWGKIKELFQ